MTRPGPLLVALLLLLGGLVLALTLQDEGPTALDAGAAPEVAARPPVPHADADGSEGTQLAAPQLPVAGTTGRIADAETTGGVVLRGRLVDENGEPVADADVDVTQVSAEALRQAEQDESEGGRRVEFRIGSRSGRSLGAEGIEGAVTAPPVTKRVARTNDDGRFEIGGLEPYALTVRAIEPGVSPDSSVTTGVVSVRRSAELTVVDPSARIELRLEAATTLRGLVVGPDGRPVNDFWVTASRFAEATRPPPPADDTASGSPFVEGFPVVSDRTVGGLFTGEDGAFRFVGLEAGLWRIVVRKGHQRAIARRPVSGTDTFQAQQEIQLPHAGVVRLVLPLPARLEGIVRTSFGHPAPFALVELTGLSGGAPNKRWSTDEEGRFEISSIRRGARYRLVAQHKDHAASEALELETNPSGANPPVELRLRAPARVTGRVHASHAQRAWRVVVLSGGASATTNTDADGRFAFDGVTPGRYRLKLAPARADGDGDGATESLVLAEGQHVDLVLGEPAAGGIRVFGTVRSGGVTLEGLEVRLSLGAATVRTTTDAEGRYELEVEQPGAHVLRITDGARQRRFDLDVPDADELRHDVELATGSLSGHVTNREGAPLASVALALRSDATGGAATTTAADGSYTFGFLPPGDYTVRLLDTDGGGAPEEGLSATLAAGEERVGLDFRLERPARIEGLVRRVTTDTTTRRVSHSTAAGVTVHLRHADGRAIATTRSDARGAFTFEAVPHGPLVVEAALGEASHEVNLTCTPGETTPVNLRLEETGD